MSKTVCKLNMKNAKVDGHHLKLKHYGLFLYYACPYEYVLGLSERAKRCQNTQMLKRRLLFTKPENNCYSFCLYLTHLFIFIQYISISWMLRCATAWIENPHRCRYPIPQGHQPVYLPRLLYKPFLSFFSYPAFFAYIPPVALVLITTRLSDRYSLTLCFFQRCSYFFAVGKRDVCFH